jgi:hypothetical protein
LPFSAATKPFNLFHGVNKGTYFSKHPQA